MYTGVKVVKLFVGPCHNLAFSDEGHIYTWGLGSYGQLGNGNLSLRQSIPIPVNGGPEDDWYIGTPDKIGNFGENLIDMDNLGIGRTSRRSHNSNTSIFPKGKVKKYLPNIAVNLWFDCSFILVSKD